MTPMLKVGVNCTFINITWKYFFCLFNLLTLPNKQLARLVKSKYLCCRHSHNYVACTPGYRSQGSIKLTGTQLPLLRHGLGSVANLCCLMHLSISCLLCKCSRTLLGKYLFTRKVKTNSLEIHNLWHLVTNWLFYQLQNKLRNQHNVVVFGSILYRNEFNAVVINISMDFIFFNFSITSNSTKNIYIRIYICKTDFGIDSSKSYFIVFSGMTAIT